MARTKQTCRHMRVSSEGLLTPTQSFQSTTASTAPSLAPPPLPSPVTPTTTTTAAEIPPPTDYHRDRERDRSPSRKSHTTINIAEYDSSSDNDDESSGRYTNLRFSRFMTEPRRRIAP